MPRRARSEEFDSREVLRTLAEAPGGSLGFHELADRCAIPTRARPRFRRFLRGLVNERVLRPAKGRGFRAGTSRPAETEWAVQGKVLRHRDGFGFVKRDDEGDDLFLPPREMRGLFAGDIVRALPVPGRYGRTAAPSGRAMAALRGRSKSRPCRPARTQACGLRARAAIAASGRNWRSGTRPA